MNDSEYPHVQQVLGIQTNAGGIMIMDPKRIKNRTFVVLYNAYPELTKGEWVLMMRLYRFYRRVDLPRDAARRDVRTDIDILSLGHMAQDKSQRNAALLKGGGRVA